jgi:hypothetical protein
MHTTRTHCDRSFKKIAKRDICFQLIEYKSNSSISFLPFFDYSITYVLQFDYQINITARRESDSFIYDTHLQ